jgi:hypothetical protein
MSEKVHQRQIKSTNITAGKQVDHPGKKTSRHVAIVVAIAAVILSLGCQPVDEIQSYRIPKTRSALPIDNIDRMVVAIAERDDATWFFKITGQATDVEATQDAWRKILSSIEFDESGKPRWDTPDGWTVGPERPLRFATLLTRNEGRPIELTVSFLGPGQDLADNVNRWRGQLGLPPIARDQLKLESVQSRAGALNLFDGVGKLDAGMMAPIANRNSTASKSESRSEPPFTFEPPKDWNVDRTNSIVRARFTKTSNEQTAQISVTEMPAEANPWEPNAKRWAREISLSDDPQFLAERTTEFALDGCPAKQLRLIPDAESSKLATIAVRLVRGDSAWFFKLTGDRTMVVEHEGEFDRFLQSFSFQQ